MDARLSRMSQRRVAVTGVGIVTALGLDETTVWANLLAGETGLAPIRGFDASECKVQIGGEVDDELLAERLAARKIRKVDRSLGLALEASGQALEGAELVTEPPYEAQDIATLLGCGVGPASTLYEGFTRFADKGPRGMRPSSVPKFMANGLSAGVSLHYRLTGTNQVIVSACASSTNAIGQGFRLIRDGYAEVVLCGGSDAFFDPFYYGAWNNLGVLSTIADPKSAYRPFDIDRDGCLLGEGAGILVLEDWQRAAGRGVRVRGEILGYGESSDATHLTSPDVAGQVRAMLAALDDAGVEAAEIGYVNAHGTATQANDLCESQSILEALGSAAGTVPVGSSKSFFGHLLGAAGVVETIATLMALEHGVLPPNLNLDHPDPQCAIALIGGKSVPTEARLAMKNSFGFGGGNAVLVLGKA